MENWKFFNDARTEAEAIEYAKENESPFMRLRVIHAPGSSRPYRIESMIVTAKKYAGERGWWKAAGQHADGRWIILSLKADSPEGAQESADNMANDEGITTKIVEVPTGHVTKGPFELGKARAKKKKR